MRPEPAFTPCEIRCSFPSSLWLRWRPQDQRAWHVSARHDCSYELLAVVGALMSATWLQTRERARAEITRLRSCDHVHHLTCPRIRFPWLSNSLRGVCTALDRALRPKGFRSWTGLQVPKSAAFRNVLWSFSLQVLSHLFLAAARCHTSQAIPNEKRQCPNSSTLTVPALARRGATWATTRKPSFSPAMS